MTKLLRNYPLETVLSGGSLWPICEKDESKREAALPLLVELISYEKQSWSNFHWNGNEPSRQFRSRTESTGCQLLSSAISDASKKFSFIPLRKQTYPTANPHIFESLTQETFADTGTHLDYFKKYLYKYNFWNDNRHGIIFWLFQEIFTQTVFETLKKLSPTPSLCCRLALQTLPSSQNMI